MRSQTAALAFVCGVIGSATAICAPGLNAQLLPLPFVSGLAGLESSGPAKTNWGKIVRGFQLGVTFKRDVFTNGESVLCFALLSNTTPSFLFYYDYAPAYGAVIVTDSSGNRLPLRQELRPKTPFEERVRKIVNNPVPFYLASRAESGFTMDLRKLYDLKIPGTFSVYATFRLPRGQEPQNPELVSGTGTVHVVLPPEGKGLSSSAQGQLILTQLVSAPFPHPQRANGREYKGQFFSAKEHYADSTVAIFIPRGFRETDRIDFVVHFHGWKNHVAQVLEHYRLLEQFQESRRNAVLVVPQGPHDAPDSFGGKLEDPDGFCRFMEEVIATLKDKSALTNRQPVLGNIILSGHSGGYQVVASILDHGGLSDLIQEVWLFDALYAQTDRFLAWFDKQHGRLVDLYTEHGGTKEETERLIGIFRQRGVPFYSGKELEVTASQLSQSEPIFLFSELEHDAVLQGNQAFRRFLESSNVVQPN